MTQITPNAPMTFAGGKVKVVPCAGGYHIRTRRKHGDFNEDLKTQLPWYARRWDSAAKAWWVKEVYLIPFVLDIIGAWFDPGLTAELDRLQAAAGPAIWELNHYLGVTR